MSWAEIIDYRQQFYIENYDVRIICEKNELPKSIAEKIAKIWKNLEKRKYYTSTRSTKSLADEEKSFLDVVIQGLASDGGLYVPKGEIPYFTLGNTKELNFDIVLPVTEQF